MLEEKQSEQEGRRAWNLQLLPSPRRNKNFKMFQDHICTCITRRQQILSTATTVLQSVEKLTKIFWRISSSIWIASTSQMKPRMCSTRYHYLLTWIIVFLHYNQELQCCLWWQAYKSDLSRDQLIRPIVLWNNLTLSSEVWIRKLFKLQLTQSQKI